MRLYASNGAITTLNGGIVAGSMGITLTDATNFPATGPFTISINDEIILIESRTGNSLSVQTRGYDGTVADAHADEDPVYSKIVAAHINEINNQDEVELGDGANASGANSVAIGHDAAATETNTAAIGYNASATVSNQFVIGNSSNNVEIPGNLKLPTAGQGLTLVSPNGLVTKTITIDNDGNIAVS